MLVTRQVAKLILWKRHKLDMELHKRKSTYDSLLNTAAPELILRNDVNDFVNEKIDVLSNKPNKRKQAAALKFLDIDTVKTTHAQDTTLHDFLKTNAVDLLENGSFIFRLNMNMYRIYSLIIQWENTCSVNQYQWWSNPFGNVIAYQVHRLAGIIPFDQLRVSETTNKRPMPVDKVPKRAHVSSIPEGILLILIYMITHKVTQKKYVGRTKNFIRRLKQHSRVDSGCRLIRDAIQMDGIQSFDKEVLAYCDAANAARVEAFFIQKYDAVTPNGYNISAGNFGFIDEEKGITALIVKPDIDPVSVDIEIMEHLRDIRDFCESADSDVPLDIKKQIRANHPDSSANPNPEKVHQLVEKLQKMRKTEGTR